MLNNQNLRKYIKLIIESTISDPFESYSPINDEEYNDETYKQKKLEDLELKYKDEILEKDEEEYYKNLALDNPTSPMGWNLLNHTILLLRQINKIYDYYSIPEKLLEIKNVLENQLDFNEIGSGAFRRVFSREDATFIVKIEKVITTGKKIVRTNTNSVEFDKYFDFGEEYQKEIEAFPRRESSKIEDILFVNHTSIFPKIYAYDQENGLWIITEKVTPFDSYDTNNAHVGLKIFQPLYSFLLQLFNLFDSLDKNINPNQSIHQTSAECSIFCIKNSIKSFSEPNTNRKVSYIFQELLDLILEIAYSNYAKSNLNLAFKNTIINKLITSWLKKFGYEHNFDTQTQLPNEYHTLEAAIDSHFINLKPTPDVEYICNILKKEKIDDIHIRNIGFRDMKNNPTEPWKNFVIFDFAGYGK